MWQVFFQKIKSFHYIYIYILILILIFFELIISGSKTLLPQTCDTKPPPKKLFVVDKSLNLQ
jgi:hypothetical protein